MKRTKNENISIKLSDKQSDASDEESFFQNRKWLNSKEAADYLRISVQNLRVKVSRGQITVNGRLGRSWRFRRDALDRLLETSNARRFHD